MAAGLSAAHGPAWGPRSASGEMLPAWGHRTGPTVAVRRPEEPRCEWQTDGWAFAGMVFIGWAMLWGLGVLNQVRALCVCVCVCVCVCINALEAALPQRAEVEFFWACSPPSLS
jgi:hypothetical protein